jgi:membrane-bound lytic murein transglycosylase B
MLTRRSVLATSVSVAVPVILPGVARATNSFQSFVASVCAEASAQGIRRETLDAAFAGVVPNQAVIQKDRRQAEFNMSWPQYRALVVNDQRIADGRVVVAANRALLSRVDSYFRVMASIVAGIWGVESNFGALTGNYKVVEALATLGWEGRRATFFRSELLAALRILNNGDITPAGMTGSYAGAMGQPQFMPSSYLRLAVDFDGDGRRDIWNSKADVLGSIANFLVRSGWHAGETWGQPVRMPPGVVAMGREERRPLSEWARMGVVPVSGRWAASGDAAAAAIGPDGPAGETFLVFNNFAAIRRYNPSDYYAIAVGLVGDLVMA